MRLPALLSRRKANVYKNNFGHVLVIAGSKNMIGASCLCGISAMRTGSGLVTLAIPKSLNEVVHKKTSSVIMTLPLNETKANSLSLSAFSQLQKNIKSYDAIAIGPGLSRNTITQKLIIKIIEKINKPMVIDADALYALSSRLKTLNYSIGTRILTPHPGEMARLTNLRKNIIEKNRLGIAKDFSKKYKCTLLLKGHRTIVASPKGQTYINKSGNAGMATAGSGDVLTGMITSLLGQGLSAFDAAKYGAFLHGKAGDLAAKKIGKASLIATDIIDSIPKSIRST